MESSKYQRRPKFPIFSNHSIFNSAISSLLLLKVFCFLNFLTLGMVSRRSHVVRRQLLFTIVVLARSKQTTEKIACTCRNSFSLSCDLLKYLRFELRRRFPLLKRRKSSRTRATCLPLQKRTKRVRLGFRDNVSFLFSTHQR